MSKNLEDPVEHESIKKYIAIRPEIKTHLINNFNIDESQIEIIYNPVDENKFKIKNSQDKNYVLFVGTVDYLRRESILDLIEYTEQNNKELWLVGENHSEYLESILLYPHVKHFPSTWELNTFISNCSETAGIQLGRTTIESWIAGKKSWIYKVDSNGFILSKELTNPPEDLEKFYSMNVAKQIKTEYLKILS
jgi:glycosyltransferase involved in cell wall biosynthesis